MQAFLTKSENNLSISLAVPSYETTGSVSEVAESSAEAHTQYHSKLYLDDRSGHAQTRRRASVLALIFGSSPRFERVVEWTRNSHATLKQRKSLLHFKGKVSNSQAQELLWEYRKKIYIEVTIQTLEKQYRILVNNFGFCYYVV